MPECQEQQHDSDADQFAAAAAAGATGHDKAFEIHRWFELVGLRALSAGQTGPGLRVGLRCLVDFRAPKSSPPATICWSRR